jgi:hypothetical protein
MITKHTSFFASVNLALSLFGGNKKADHSVRLRKRDRENVSSSRCFLPQAKVQLQLLTQFTCKATRKLARTSNQPASRPTKNAKNICKYRNIKNKIIRKQLSCPNHQAPPFAVVGQQKTQADQPALLER